MRTRWPSVFAAALALVLCASTLACRSAEEKFDTHIERGQEFEQAGKRDEALIEYRNALRLQPSSAEANFRIARVLIQKGNYGEAAFFYRETTRLDPTRSDAALAEAKLLLFDDAQRAEEITREVLAREPDNALAHLRLAELALAKDDTKTAHASVLTAIELAPKDGLYPYNLGVVQQSRIREMRVQKEEPPDEIFQSAIGAFRKADELYGGDRNARIMLARTYASWPGHAQEAEAALRDALAFAKDKGSAEDRRAVAQAVLDYAAISGRPELRAIGLEEMVEADPAALSAWVELAASADAKGESGDAVYQKLLAARPKDLGAYVAYASWLASKGRGDDAVRVIDDAAEKAGDPAAALDAKTRLLLQLAKTDDARATAERLRKEFPSSPRTALAEGRVAFAERRSADAVTALRRVTGSLEDAEAFQLLSLAEAALGNLEPATAAIDRALALTPEPALPMLQQKVAVHVAARDWQAALQALQRVEARFGDVPVGLRPVLAQAFYETGDATAGRRVLERMLADPATLAMAAVIFSDREGQRDPQKAYAHLDTALAAAPGEPPIIAALVRLDLATKKSERALERLDAALVKVPENAALRLLRAQVRAAKNDIDGAKADAQEVLESGANLPGTVDLLMALYAARGNLDEAAESLEAMDAAGRLRGPSRELLARLYQARGDLAAARAQLEKALVDDPSLAAAKNGLAFLLASEKADLDRALTLAQDAQRQLPNVPEVVDTLGFVYLQKGLTDAAIDRFRYALELAAPGAGSLPTLRYHLGLALAAAGRSQEAAEAFEAALAAGGDFPEAEAARRELDRVRTAAPAGADAGS